MSREFLRPGSIRIYRSGSPRSHGTKWAVEDYPFQGLDLPHEPAERPVDWYDLVKAAAGVVRSARASGLDVTLKPAGRAKWKGSSPFGTPLDVIARRELGMPARDGWEQASDAWHPGDALDF